MRKTAFLLLILLPLSLPLAVFAQAPVVQSPSFYVNDYARILFDQHREDMAALARRLDEQTGAQVVVLTVQSLGGASAGSYGQAVIDGWGIGGEGGKRGALILVALDESIVRVLLGEELDALSESRNVETEIPSNNISRAVADMHRALVRDVYEQSGIAPDAQALELLDDPPAARPFTIGPAFFFAVVLIAVLRSFRTSRKYRQKYAKGYVRKAKTYTRNYDEEHLYSDGNRYRGDSGGGD